jgi:hypothetical protein
MKSDIRAHPSTINEESVENSGDSTAEDMENLRISKIH